MNGECIGCGGPLAEDDATLSCTEHPTCTGCLDPLRVCRECTTAQNEAAAAEADERAADDARDLREATAA